MARRHLATLVLLAIALALRFAFINWGAPFTYHPDEHFLVQPATAIAASGDLNPHWFGYPSLCIYVEAAVARLAHTVAATPLNAPAEDGGLGPWDVSPSQWKLVWAGRCVVALIGALGVWLGMRAARQLSGSDAAAWITGVIVAVSPLHVENSHYLTTDIAASTLAVLALLLTGKGNLYAAAIVAGLAASTKYTAGVILIVPLGAALLGARRTRAAPAVLAAALLGFVAGSPYALLDWSAFWHDLAAQREHYLNATTIDSGRFYLVALFHQGLSWHLAALLPLALIGTVFSRHGERRTLLLLVVTCTAYFAVLSAYPQRYERNLVLLIPLLAVLLGSGLVYLAQRIAPRSVGPLCVVVTCLALPGLAASVGFVRDLGLPHTRTVAYRWIVNNVGAGSRIAREEYTPVLATSGYDVRFLWSLGFREYGYYLSENFDYLVVSSGVYERLMAPPYPAGAAVAHFYEMIFAKLPLRVEIAPDATQRGPTIRIYQVPHG